MLLARHSLPGAVAGGSPAGPDPASLPGSPWSPDPTLLVAFALAAVLYAVGWRRLDRQGRGRARLPAWRGWCYAAGLATLALALLSPIHIYGEFLFSVHMVQHLLLTLVAPPLLWLGAPLLPILWGLPRSLRLGLGRLFAPGQPVQRVFHTLTSPLVAMALYMVTLALWHLPALYDAAQGRALAHDLEHLMFLATALLYWWPLVHPTGGRPRLRPGFTLLYLLPPMIEGDLIGALLSFAQRPLYATYQAAPRVSSLSPVADQQLGGLIMWVGGGLFWLGALAVVFFVESGGAAAAARRSPWQAGAGAPAGHVRAGASGR